ncbi:1525_t:CDS:2 [Acaulospora morrowiae]|uniref:aromatase n=1 Tax=Acaulospora morrowiae TaxID=94023 RepID=A0A9N8YMZ5_9GLOM|nr:1525_t:CDS:2 [Acaulospora morrowiae]
MEIYKVSFGVYELFMLSSTLLTISIINYYYRYYTRKNPLPAPFPLPFVGHLFDDSIYSNNFCDHLQLLHSKYGDIYEQWYGRIRIIFVTKPEYVEKLLSASTKSKYLIRVSNPEGLKDLGVYGRGLLLNNDVNSWKYNRQFLSQAILTSNFLKESVDCTQAIFNEMEEYWRVGLEDNTVTDFTEWSHSLTTDIIFKLITGKKMWTVASYFLNVSPKLKLMKMKKFDEKIINESSKISKAFQRYIAGLDFFLYTPGWVRNYIPSFRATQREIFEAQRLLYENLGKIIQERRKEIENTPKDEKLRYDMLTQLVTANTDRSISDINNNQEFTKPLSDEDIRDIVIEALGGGIDTTANVLCFVIYYLAHHPDVKNRMIQEIDELFSQNQNRPITYDDLPQLIYCEAVIKEVSRVMPTTPFVGRVSSEPDRIDNVEWEANTRYMIFTPVIHSNKNYWNEPEKFDVNRFIDVDEQKKHSEKNHLIMWGGGLRQCPGRKLAMIELKCMLALTFRNWDVELADMDSPLKSEISIVRSAKDLKVKIKPRNNKMKNT